MIRTKAVEWCVQVRENGRWHDHHHGIRPGPAIRAYGALDVDTNDKRLLRNGEPLRMSPPDQLALNWSPDTRRSS